MDHPRTNQTNCLNSDFSPVVLPARSETDRSFWDAVIKAASAAPSADNNQPWMLKASRSAIDIYWNLDRRLPSDDGMFDLLSIGAAIENIALQLSDLGYRNKVELSGDELSGKLQHVASILFEKDQHVTKDDLAKFIFERHTNRYAFERASISADTLREIKESAEKDNFSELAWEAEQANIKRLSSLVALSDSLRFRYQEFHEELHRQLRLTPKHANETRDGLDYRTLGLPPGGRQLLSLLRPWKTMAFLNRFGLSKLLSIPSAHMVRQSGAIGFMFVKDRTAHSFLNGGRAMQRAWLKAAKCGLAVHPLGSLPNFLYNDSIPCE